MESDFPFYFLERNDFSLYQRYVYLQIIFKRVLSETEMME